MTTASFWNWLWLVYIARIFSQWIPFHRDKSLPCLIFSSEANRDLTWLLCENTSEAPSTICLGKQKEYIISYWRRKYSTFLLVFWVFCDMETHIFSGNAGHAFHVYFRVKVVVNVSFYKTLSLVMHFHVYQNLQILQKPRRLSIPKTTHTHQPPHIGIWVVIHVFCAEFKYLH